LKIHNFTSQRENCGLGPVSRRHALGFRKVADGSDAKIIDYPWMVSIGSFKGQNDYTHICGGSLISTKFVLTAAGCFNFGNDYRRMTMLFGIDNLNNRLSSDDYFERGIKGISIHDDYKSRKLILE
jgi:secreted trypsin-like serine protease